MNTRLTDDQHQKAVHLLAERLTLQASLGDVYAHYYQSQARSPDMLDSTAMLYALEDAGLTLEDLR